jgi:hypothetical protein
MKKTFLIFIGVIILFYVYQFLNNPKVGVKKNVRPYLEECLALIINKQYDKVYETYVKTKLSSMDDFNKGMAYLTELYGTPISYYYLRSYIGGTGYFVQYNITFENGETHSCFFEFPITKENEIIRKEGLERLSISGDFGKKQFTLFFKTGKITACRSPEGCFGEDN